MFLPLFAIVVLNRDFGADSGTQGRLVSECLPRASFSTVGLQVKRVWQFLLSVRTFKVFKSLFIIGELLVALFNSLTFKLIAREVSAAT